VFAEPVYQPIAVGRQLANRPGEASGAGTARSPVRRGTRGARVAPPTRWDDAYGRHRGAGPVRPVPAAHAQRCRWMRPTWQADSGTQPAAGPDRHPFVLHDRWRV